MTRAGSGSLRLAFPVTGMDFASAGEAAGRIKKTLQQLGFPSEVVRRAAVAAYEAEMNIVIHAYHGEVIAEISPGSVVITATDTGPGIPDVEKAFQEGFSTAPDRIREMGFGAGMGLPNIRRCSDELTLTSEVGRGTKLVLRINAAG